MTWLYPERSRFKYYLSLLLYLRFTGALIEEFPAIPTLDSREIIYAGTVTMKSMTEMFSRSEAVTCALALLSALPPEFSFEIERLINPWLPSALHPSPRAALINSDLLVMSILGIAILTVASKLPRDPFEAHQKLDQSEDLRNELADFVIENTASETRIAVGHQRFGAGPVRSIAQLLRFFYILQHRPLKKESRSSS